VSSLPITVEADVWRHSDGALLLDLLALAGWEIHVTLHDLGVKVLGRKGANEVVRFGGSLAEVTIDFFKAAHAGASVRPADDSVRP
jgi:hypothetical protein